MSPSVSEVILHCQRQIKKDQSEEKLLHYIGRLSRLRIGTTDLIQTGIGRTVNQLSRMEGVVGEKAYELVTNWKALVEAERSESSGEESGPASSSEEENEIQKSKSEVVAEEEDTSDASPPRILVNGRVPSEDEEPDSALPTFVNYSRNQDESDNESDNDSDNSDRLCIDDAATSKQGVTADSEESEMDEVEVSTNSAPEKFFPSSSSESEESETDERRAKQHRVKHQTPSPSKTEERSRYRLSEKQHKSRDSNNSPAHSETRTHRSDRRRRSKSRSTSPKHHHHKTSKVKVQEERMSSSRSPSPAIESYTKHTTKNGFLAVPSISTKKEKDSSPSRSFKPSPSKSRDSSPQIQREKEKTSREKVKEKDQDRKRKGDFNERDEKHLKKSKVEVKTPEKKVDPLDCLKPKLAPRLNVEIDSTSGLNFSDVLSGLDTKRLKKSPKKVSPVKKMNESPSTSSTNTPEKQSTFTSSTPAPSEQRIPNEKSSRKLKEKRSGETAPRAVAKVSPFAYTSPMPPAKKLVPPPEHVQKLVQELEASTQEDNYWEDSQLTMNGSYAESQDALSTMMSSRNQRTKVYSGVKTGKVGKVPTLFKLCMTVVQENIDALEYTGGIPFEILEPILRRITLDQLINVEHFNPYLIESTDDIWRYHCNQKFRGRVPEELETWRELYFRCVEEQSARFESLTSKLKTKLEVAAPVRKAQLAIIESHSGPKFNKSKAATIKTGMSSLKTREEKGAGRSHGSSASSGGGGNNQNNILIEHAAVVISGKGRAGTAPAVAVSRESSAAARKPKKAPLMQKTLKSMKTLMRR